MRKRIRMVATMGLEVLACVAVGFLPLMAGCPDNRPLPTDGGRESVWRQFIPALVINYNDLDEDGVTDSATVVMNAGTTGDTHASATVTVNGQSSSGSQSQGQNAFSVTIAVPEEGDVDADLEYTDDQGHKHCKKLWPPEVG